MLTVAQPTPSDALTVETAQGNAIAVWRAFDGVSNSLWANERVGGVWQKARLLENQDGAVGAVTLGTDTNGNAIAVWEQGVGTEQLIWAAHYTLQYAWEPATVISLRAAAGQTPGVVATNPQLSFDANGIARASWQQTDSVLYPRTWENLYLPGVGWQGAHAITP